MGKHFKIGLGFGFLSIVAFLLLCGIARGGVETAGIIRNGMLIPLEWIWDLCGVSGCQAIDSWPILLMSIPVYLFISGFLFGFLLSIVIEIVLVKFVYKY